MEQPPDNMQTAPPGAPPPTHARHLPHRSLPQRQPPQKSPDRTPTTPSLPTPSGAPTPSAEQLPPRGRAGEMEGDELDEEFDAMVDSWDDEEAIEREMFPDGEASEVLLQGHDVVGETDSGQAHVPRHAASPPRAARPVATVPVAGAAGASC